MIEIIGLKDQKKEEKKERKKEGLIVINVWCQYLELESEAKNSAEEVLIYCGIQICEV